MASTTPDLFAALKAGRGAPVGLAVAAALAETQYDLTGAIDLLTGERDENFRIAPSGKDRWILKIFGRAQPASEADLLAAILRHVAQAAPGLPVPRVRTAISGAETITFTDADGHARQAIVYSFRPGIPLIDAPRTPAQRRRCGALLAETAIALRGFAHPAACRDLMWDLRHLPQLRTLAPQIADLPFADFVRGFLDDFAVIEPRLARVPAQFVHNDFNARNIIVDDRDTDRVAGIIDFGDAVHTARIADVAIGVIGQLATADSAEAAMREFVEAYRAVVPLEAEEMQLLPTLVAGRIVQNVVLTSWYRAHAPDGTHFAAFGPDFFAWRVALARRLLAGI